MNKDKNEEMKENQKFDTIMNEQKQLKNQGDSYLLNKEYIKAEGIYNIILTNIGNLPNDTGEIEISQEQTNTMLSLLKGVYGNLSLAQAKQFKLTEAINTTTYILTKLDPYYDKGYIRIIKWLIVLEQFERALEVENQIKSTFTSTKQFEEVLSFLHMKKEENDKRKRNVLSRESYINSNTLLFGCFSVGLSVLFIGLVWKYFKR